MPKSVGVDDLPAACREALRHGTLSPPNGTDQTNYWLRAVLEGGHTPNLPSCIRNRFTFATKPPIAHCCASSSSCRHVKGSSSTRGPPHELSSTTEPQTFMRNPALRKKT